MTVVDISAALSSGTTPAPSEDQLAVLKYMATTGLLPPASGNLALQESADGPHANSGDRVQWSVVQRFLLGPITQVLEKALNTPQGQADAQNFEAENSYLIEQFNYLESPPFTLQRLCEVIINPQQYHMRKNPDGALGKESLRGDVLQAAIRRCVLVASVDY